MIVGAVIGGVISWLFSRNSSNELRRVHEDLRGSIKELSKSFTEISSLYSEALEELRASRPERANELAAKYNEEAEKNKQVVSSLPKEIKEEINPAMYENMRTCPICGKYAHPAGYGADQGGAMVWWYACPEHGRFPGNHIDDFME